VSQSKTIENEPAGAALLARLTDAVGRAVVGKTDAIELMLTAILCEGHVLIEDVPGTGKTLLAKVLARALDLSFRRIQFTPDLLPSDITGSNVFNQRAGDFEFRRGPLFANVVLADEINRATPRTQAALLEAMEERQITADGTTMALDRPFLVLATQNPVELEGTFPLPEAQLDRFLFQLRLGYPSAEEESAILSRNATGDTTPQVQPCLTRDAIHSLQQQVAQVHVADDVRDYIAAIVRMTRDWPTVQLGASPRSGVALYRSARALACIRGRSYVLPDDVKYLVPSVLSHRLILAPEARLKAERATEVLMHILEKAPVPVESAPGPSAKHA